MYIYFENEISTETVNDLIGQISGHDKVTLYFSTEGGSPEAMRFLIDYLNSLGDAIEIVLTSYIASAGTFLLTHYKGKLSAKNLDYVLFHVIDRQNYNLRKDYSYSFSTIQKQDVKSNKVFSKKLRTKGFLTEVQINNFLKGYDVVVYQKQMKTWKL